MQKYEYITAAYHGGSQASQVVIKQDMVAAIQVIHHYSELGNQKVIKKTFPNFFIYSIFLIHLLLWCTHLFLKQIL